ncbi:MAG: metallophosphatase domain-containing protein [Methylomicrobium sp.]|nr:metallophosphatase domain-containing protein [Methylomicrobium sp.]
MAPIDNQNKPDLRLVCLSDLHDAQQTVSVPDGDVLIVAGDICLEGRLAEVKRFDDWLGTLPHRCKLVIAGNHDWPFEIVGKGAAINLLKNAIYLEDESIEINGVNFWGSPWQPEFCDWAFNLPRGPRLAEIWDGIPSNTDVLITHTPPYGILDEVFGEHVGCEALAVAVQRVRPKFHVFGHIHECHGVLKQGETTYVNASLHDERFCLRHQPIVLDV